jgi:hypothetical protein
MSGEGRPGPAQIDDRDFHHLDQAKAMSMPRAPVGRQAGQLDAQHR